MLGRLAQRTAIVTGASSGLGRAIALRYAAEGARVVCADLVPTARNIIAAESEPTHELIRQRHGDDAATFVVCDVRSEEAVAATVSAAVEWGGRLDVMVNNAGALASLSPLPESLTWSQTLTAHRHLGRGRERLRSHAGARDADSGLGPDIQHQHARRLSRVQICAGAVPRADAAGAQRARRCHARMDCQHGSMCFRRFFRHVPRWLTMWALARVCAEYARSRGDAWRAELCVEQACRDRVNEAGCRRLRKG